MDSEKTPVAGRVITTFLSLASLAVITTCLSQRLKQVRSWRGLSITQWLVLIIYIDSSLFIILSAVLAHGFGLNTSQQTCESAIFICLICYLTTKLIYYFLIEKAYIVSGVETPRLKSKLYCANIFGMLGLYTILAIMNFVFRIARFDDDGYCIIGMERKVLIPVDVFDVIVNIYLTALFIIPLRRLHAFKNNPNSPLRVMTVRTFIGSCCTLLSSLANITVVVVLNGERAWICLMLCNCDVLFSAFVIHWITNRDSPSGDQDKTRTTDAQISDFHRNKTLQGSLNSSVGIPANSLMRGDWVEEDLAKSEVDIGKEDGVSISQKSSVVLPADISLQDLVDEAYNKRASFPSNGAR